MSFVQSGGTIRQFVSTPWWAAGPLRSSVRLYDQRNYDYATLYRLQPNIRTCVDFLSRNIAQLGLHAYRRLSGSDRERLLDHDLARLIKQPMPRKFKMTTYRLINSIIGDLGIYYNAYLLKVRVDGQLALLRIPPLLVLPVGELAFERYDISVGGKTMEFLPDDIVHFWGYNPENALVGLSPLETLRRILAEEESAGEYREGFWRNSARINGVIERPATAPDWNEKARTRFLTEFQAMYSGGLNSGKTVVLEDGMTWRDASFTPRDSEYLGGRKLTREECARAYHIPPPLVGILDHATFSNIEEQHKSLYSDTLGPWLRMLESDIELQLISEFEGVDDVYVEFNISEKLRGNFEEQIKALQAAVGRPWMSANEARGIMNMPASESDGADELVVPLNVLIGGQASPRDSTPEQRLFDDLGEKAIRRVSSRSLTLKEQYEKLFTNLLKRHYTRQRAAIVSRVPKSAKSDIGGVWWDDERWDRELFEDLYPLNVAAAEVWSSRVDGVTGSTTDQGRMLPWLKKHAEVTTALINREMRQRVSEALLKPDHVDEVRSAFDRAIDVGAGLRAIELTLSVSSFGTAEASRAGGLRQKTWNVNSSNPRPEHALLDGETVGIDETFSNGMVWPGDPVGGVENNSNCQCTVTFSRSEGE